MARFCGCELICTGFERKFLCFLIKRRVEMLKKSVAMAGLVLSLMANAAWAGDADYCVTTQQVDGKNYLYNNCGERINVWWRDAGSCSGSGCSCGIDAHSRTSCGGGLTGIYEYQACTPPKMALEKGCH
jgi:hypothetical protein